MLPLWSLLTPSLRRRMLDEELFQLRSNRTLAIAITLAGGNRLRPPARDSDRPCRCQRWSTGAAAAQRGAEAARLQQQRRCAGAGASQTGARTAPTCPAQAGLLFHQNSVVKTAKTSARSLTHCDSTPAQSLLVSSTKRQDLFIRSVRCQAEPRPEGTAAPSQQTKIRDMSTFMRRNRMMHLRPRRRPAQQVPRPARVRCGQVRHRGRQHRRDADRRRLPGLPPDEARACCVRQERRHACAPQGT